MTATTELVPIAITCPDWCEVDPTEHVADLWEMGGNVIHRSGVMQVDDPTGFREALSEPRMHKPVMVEFTCMTRPDGVETSSPVVYLGEQEHSLEQIELLTSVLASLLSRCRA